MCCYVNPGCQISNIISRVAAIVGTLAPSVIVIHIGGNDLEEMGVDVAMLRYESMIQNIQAVSGNTSILVSAIGPRKQDAYLNTKIFHFNELVKLLAECNDNVLYYVECIPIGLNFYKYDRVHLNTLGKRCFAINLANSILHCINFPKLSHHVIINSQHKYRF